MDVRVEIAPGGKTTIDVSGVVGPSCGNVAEALAKAMAGTDVDTTKKPEYHEHGTDSAKVNA